jgi:hypothetical protein
LAAAYHLKLAVEALRRIGGMGDRADELHARLLDYERRGMAEMETHSVGTDLTDCARQAEAHVADKELPDALLALASVTSPTDVDHLRQSLFSPLLVGRIVRDGFGTLDEDVQAAIEGGNGVRICCVFG